MDEIVKIIRHLISKKGIDILLDKNLFNILNDLSSTLRGNQNYQKIVRVIVQNSLMQSIMDTGDKNRNLTITSISKRIKSEYWLNADDSIRLLCALSMGANLINKEECEQILFGKKAKALKEPLKKDKAKSINDEPLFFVNGMQIFSNDGSPSKSDNEDGEENVIDLTDVSSQCGNTYDTLTTTKVEVPLDPREPFTNYAFPSIALLTKNDYMSGCSMDEIKANNADIVETFMSFGFYVRKINAIVGAASLLHELTFDKGVRYSKINRLKDDIVLSMPSSGVQILAPIPGRSTVGVIIQRKNPAILSLENVFSSREFNNASLTLPLALGRTLTNEVQISDLVKLPHLLIAGGNEKGKTTLVKNIIVSLLYKKHPNEIKLIIINSTKVEYDLLLPIANHYMAALPENEGNPIISGDEASVRTLDSLCKLMDKRLEVLNNANAKGIIDYNEKFIHHRLIASDTLEYMPRIIVIVDEYDDFMMTAGKEFTEALMRLTQKAQSVGIHLILVTNRITSKVITSGIKASIPARIAFQVSTASESKIILDQAGAECLYGNGDFLLKEVGGIIRVQAPFVNNCDLNNIALFISRQPGPVEPMELPDPDSDFDNNPFDGANSIGLDPYFDEAARAIVITQMGSTAMIQRRFSIGYNRAGRLMDQLEAAGIVGPAQGSKPREVMLSDENSLNALLNRLHGND